MIGMPSVCESESESGAEMLYASEMRLETGESRVADKTALDRKIEWGDKRSGGGSDGGKRWNWWAESKKATSEEIRGNKQ